MLLSKLKTSIILKQMVQTNIRISTQEKNDEKIPSLLIRISLKPKAKSKFTKTNFHFLFFFIEYHH